MSKAGRSGGSSKCCASPTVYVGLLLLHSVDISSMDGKKVVSSVQSCLAHERSEASFELLPWEQRPIGSSQLKVCCLCERERDVLQFSSVGEADRC